MTHLIYQPTVRTTTPMLADVRYPTHRELSRDEAAALLSRMPDPSRFEIVEED